MTTVGISEGDLAELLFRHIYDLTIWCRMVLVSKKFCQVSKKLIKIKKQESSSLYYKNIKINFNGSFFEKVWYDNGRTKSITHFLKDQKNGVRKVWYEDGCLYYKCDIYDQI